MHVKKIHKNLKKFKIEILKSLKTKICFLIY